MGPGEFARLVADRLNRANIRYFISGSMASMIYGEQRTTDDVDVVLSVELKEVAGIVDAFAGDDWYCDRDMVRDAVANHRMCNVIHIPSGFKADLIVVDEDGFDASRFDRRRQIVQGRTPVWISAPEDVILKKLLSYQEGGSDKHLRDIAGMFKISGAMIDYAYAEHWALRLGVSKLWRYVLEQVPRQRPGIAE